MPQCQSLTSHKEGGGARKTYVIKDTLPKCPVLVQNNPCVISNSNAD